jgi:hypothetical protein
MFANILQAIQAAIASLMASLTGTTTGTPITGGTSDTGSPILPTLGGGGSLFNSVPGTPLGNGPAPLPAPRPVLPFVPPVPIPAPRPTLPAVTPDPLPPRRPGGNPPPAPNPLPGLR